jgi:ribosomal protein S6
MINNKEDMLVKVYELGYHLVPSLAEEEVPQYVNKIKEMLDSYGAVVISEEFPELMNLAYTMYPSVKNKKQKYSTSYFGWVKFEVDTASAQEIKANIEAIDEVFRSLLVITVRENTMAPKKLFAAVKKPLVKRSVEEKVEIDEEVVDKEIEALVDAPLDIEIETESVEPII